MSEPRAHIALLVDFANLRQQLESSSSAPTGDTASGQDAPGQDAPDQDAPDQDASGNGASSGASRADTALPDTALPDTALPDTALPDIGEIARAIVRFSGGLGRIGVARAYADWSREPGAASALNGTRLAPVLVPATDDGEDRSHIRLVIDAMEALYNGDEPDAFVIVSSDPSLVPLVQAIRADGSEVVLMANDNTQSEEMRAEADLFVTFEEVLGGLEGAPIVPRQFRDRGGSSSGAADTPSGSPAREKSQRQGPFAGMPVMTEPEFESYDWSGFIQLIDELEQRLPFVGVRYLVNKVLGPHNCGIDDPHLKRDLINEAVDDGLIEMYTVGNVQARTDPVTACRLDRENPLVREVLGDAVDVDLAGDEDDEGEPGGPLEPEDAGEFLAATP